MAKDKTAAGGSFVQGMLQTGVYKRSQGRVTRQVTFAAVLLAVVLAAWRIHQLSITTSGATFKFVIPGVILTVGIWFSYRLVNLPRFADFLIAVEAEMNKVSWPTRAELIRHSLVVIFVIFFLAILLFGYDFAWRSLFDFIGVLRGGGQS